MTWRDVDRIVRKDLYRHMGASDTRTLVKTYLTVPGFQYTAVMRACHKLASSGRLGTVAALVLLKRYQRRWGIIIPQQTEIGEGFYIGHWGGIVINFRAKIGRNVNIGQGVTIGQANRGKRQGNAVIGDGVWIGPGAKIIGAVTIGDNVIIGPNCVIVDDVPANAVVVASPGTILSETGGAESYIDNRV